MKVDLYFAVILWKTIQVPTQHSRNRDHQHHKWLPRKSWISFRGYQDAQDKQRTQYQLTPRSKWKMLRSCWKFQNRNVQTLGYVYHDTNGPDHGPVWQTQSFLLSEICMVILWHRCCRKAIFEKVPLEHGWEKVPNWECLFVHHPKGLFSSVYVDDIKLAGHKQNLDPMWKSTQCRRWSGRTNIVPWSCSLAVHSKTMRNELRYCWQLQNHVRIQNFRKSEGKTAKLGNTEDFHVVLRHGRSCQKVCGTLLWRVEIRGRIVRRMPSDCPDMPVFGTHW